MRAIPVSKSCLAGLSLGLAFILPAGAEETIKNTVLTVMEADQPYGVLRTVGGRMFVGVHEAQPDATGLTFRHRGGAARISRGQLTAADQKRFGLPTEPAPQPKASVEAGAAPEHSAPAPFAWESPNVSPLVFTYRVRTVLPSYPSAALGCQAQSCADALWRTAWPTHWARPHYGL
ncbi:MAG: hypothetical protein KDL87_06870, partial [Verrucomicrobiae bacterium]|nr:hypothetical protein [Verrucomicrobiae bacterium]